MPEELTIIHKFHLDSLSLTMDRNATYADWERAGRELGTVAKATAFWIGDWCIAGIEAGFIQGDVYTEAAMITSLDPDTVEDYTSLARKIVAAVRRSELSIRHHQAVRALPPVQQIDILAQAVAHEWTSDETREKVFGKKIPFAPVKNSRQFEGSVILQNFASEYGDLKIFSKVVKTIRELTKENS